MKKRILSLILATAMAFSLSACSGGSNSTANDTGNTETTKAETVSTDVDDTDAGTTETESADAEAITGINPEWAETTTFYQLFVRSFADSNDDGIGDFKGITENLDYLKELGIGAIWLMPMMESTTYHGYDVVDYYTPNPDYGTIEDFDELVAACHEKDIKIIIDFVVNHTSSENEWFKSALADENSPYRDFYYIEESIPVAENDAEYFYWKQDADTGLYYYAHYDTIMPDLNYNNQEVHDEIKNVAKFWLDHGIDGFRLDGAKEIDTDIEVTLDWWKEFTSEVCSVKQDAFIVGENWTSEFAIVGRYYEAMPSSFNFIAADNILSMAKGQYIDIIANMNQMRDRYEMKVEKSDVNAIMIDSVMIGNHDMDRIITRLNSTEKAKLAATIQFTIAGTPFIYYGEEIGQAGQKPDDNRREPFDWYASSTGDYMTEMTDIFFNPVLTYVQPFDGVSVEEEKDDADSMFNHYKKLIAMRNENPTFYNGTYETLGMGGGGLYAYKVYDENAQYLVIHNQRKDDKTITLNVDGTDIYNNVEVSAGSYELKAYSSLILKYESDVNPINEADFEQEEAKTFTVTFRVTVPENTPDEPIYIIGTFDNWTVADEAYIMTKVDDYTYEYTMTGAELSSIEYKYNRGTWDAREQNAEHVDLVGPLQKENRDYTYYEDNYVVEDTIDSWSDIQ